jgi:hypothetical protein
VTAGEIGTQPAQKRVPAAGIVADEGGGTAPHAVGGGVGWRTRIHPGLHAQAVGDAA